MPESLDEFRGRRRHKRWYDTLPEDIIEQIMESDAGSRVIAAWLVEIGYEDATANKIEMLLTERRRLRG